MPFPASRGGSAMSRRRGLVLLMVLGVPLLGLSLLKFGNLSLKLTGVSPIEREEASSEDPDESKLLTEEGGDVRLPGGHAIGEDAYDGPLPEGALGRIGSDLLRPAGDVSALAFGPDGTILATGGQEGEIAFWEVASGKLRRR